MQTGRHHNAPNVSKEWSKICGNRIETRTAVGGVSIYIGWKFSRQDWPYDVQSAQKIIRARDAITTHGTHTLARVSLITSHETPRSPRTFRFACRTYPPLTARTPRLLLRRFSRLVPGKSEGRSVRTLSRGDFENASGFSGKSARFGPTNLCALLGT